MRIEIVDADLVAQPDMDAIVNAANSMLLGGGGVDGAIHAAAGPQLLFECRRVKRSLPDGLLAPGRAVVTGAGALPNTWVVHTVGPNRHRGQTDPAVLAACFTESVRAAARVGARSMAFPAIGAGAYGWDMHEVARIALHALGGMSGAETGSVEVVRIVLWGSSAYATWCAEADIARTESMPAGSQLNPGLPIVGLPSSLARDRALVMGILNVTPDSFSDGGRWHDPQAAIARGRALFAHGADIVDVGGESTRPGARRVPVEEELARVIPVIEALAVDDIVISVDTMRADVAAAAVAAGARIVNDVSGGLADPAMAEVVAGLDTPYIAMHWRAPSEQMAAFTDYGDVVADVIAELATRIDQLTAAGISRDRLIVDPGLGFAKTLDHNWEILGRLDEFAILDRPMLLGASRKRFLGALLAVDGEAVSPGERDDAGIAVSAMAAVDGVWGVRVHEPHGNVAAVKAARAWREKRRPR